MTSSPVVSRFEWIRILLNIKKNIYFEFAQNKMRKMGAVEFLNSKTNLRQVVLSRFSRIQVQEKILQISCDIVNFVFLKQVLKGYTKVKFHFGF